MNELISNRSLEEKEIQKTNIPDKFLEQSM